jgi:hypothetical protein
MNPKTIITTLLTCLAVGAFISEASAADISDLKDAYYGNHWSLVNPQLEPQPGLLTITAKRGRNFDATLEKVGGHNGQRIVAVGSGKVEPSGHILWVGHVLADGVPVIKVTFTGTLSVTGKAIGGGMFTARGSFPDGVQIDDRSFFQWETPVPQN